jgi:ubiquinone/menaquinone biosynthesis C-methylase UbiE
MRLHLGCGDVVLDGYVNVDLYNDKADVQCDVKKLFYDNDVADEIYSSHLIEHFHFHEAFAILAEWKRVLKSGGWLVIETPDLLATCKKFVEATTEAERIALYGHFYGRPWEKGNTHYFLYTPVQMKWTLETLGFKNIHQQLPVSHMEIQDTCMKFLAQK